MGHKYVLVMKFMKSFWFFISFLIIFSSGKSKAYDADVIIQKYSFSVTEDDEDAMEIAKNTHLIIIRFTEPSISFDDFTKQFFFRQRLPVITY